jgi:hypothetical protein
MPIWIRKAKISADLRAHFDLYGKEVIAIALGLGTIQGGTGLGAAPVMPTRALMIVHGNQDAAAAWLREQRDPDELREAGRFWGMRILTLIAAVAACIAAWPIIHG